MEETTPILTDTEILASRRLYARQYQNKRYSDNKELGATKSSIAYHKKNGNLTKDDIDKYGIYSPYIIKAKTALDHVKEKNPVLIKEYLISYLECLD